MKEDFQLVAGHVALDFANTLDNRYDPAKRVELLSSYERFLAFARQSGVPAPVSETSEAAAREAMAQIVDLREAMHFLFLSVAVGEAPPRDALDTLNRWLAQARAAQRLGWEEGQFGWRFPTTGTAVSPVYPVVLAAADLLTSPDLAFVRECGAENCRWLFLDRSKNHSRRWCDMKICGNRAKAQRFHSREWRTGKDACPT